MATTYIGDNASADQYPSVIGGNPRYTRSMPSSDPTAVTWSTYATTGTIVKSYSAVACVHNGVLYHGLGLLSSMYYRYMYALSMTTGIWTAKASDVKDRSYAAYAVANNAAGDPVLYTFGGYSTANAYFGAGSDYSRGYILPGASVGGNTWFNLTHKYDIRLQAAVTDTVNNMIYIAGGNARTKYYNYFYSYDPVAGTYADLAVLPVSLYDQAMGFTDGYIYVLGGISGGVIQDKIYKYTIATNTWETLTETLPVGLQRTAFYNDTDGVYMTGGLKFGGGNSDATYFFGFATETVTTLTGALSAANYGGSLVKYWSDLYHTYSHSTSEIEKGVLS